MERILGPSRPLTDDDSRHGKYSTYMNLKCRCSKCKRANANQAMKRKYGISLNDRDRMIEAQGWGCAACSIDLRKLPPRQIHIDHNHDTGEVRGILCHGCNIAFGHLGEDSDRIEGLLAYSRKHDVVLSLLT